MRRNTGAIVQALLVTAACAVSPASSAADAADAAQSVVLEQVSAGVAVRMSVLYHLLAGEEGAE